MDTPQGKSLYVPLWAARHSLGDSGTHRLNPSKGLGDAPGMRLHPHGHCSAFGTAPLCPKGQESYPAAAQCYKLP